MVGRLCWIVAALSVAALLWWTEARFERAQALALPACRAAITAGK